MKGQPRPKPRRPRHWRSLGIHRPDDRLALILPSIRIMSIPGRISCLEAGAHWPRLAVYAAREKRKPLLLFRDVWSGSRAGLLDKEIWYRVYRAPPRGWVSEGECHLIFEPDLRTILHQYAEIVLTEQRQLPNRKRK